MELTGRHRLLSSQWSVFYGNANHLETTPLEDLDWRVEEQWASCGSKRSRFGRIKHSAAMASRTWRQRSA